MDVFKELTFTNSFWAFFIPSMMMFADITTGLIYSWVKKKFKSSVMRQGLGKKVGELTVIALVNLICYGTNAPDCIAVFVSGYVMFMEGMSICENLKKLGVKIPIIDKILDNAANEIQKKDRKEDTRK